MESCNEYKSVAMLNVQQVDKAYKQQAVLKQLSLTVQRGEFFGLVGVNGAGKTTLLKTLLDFCAADAGQIEINGQSHLQAQARQDLAFLPEQFMPPWFLSGEAFLRQICQLRDLPYQVESVHHLCQALDLPITALPKLIRHYSKGMAQKLGLIGCFIQQRPLLVLDEPMSGLDPKARAYLKQYLRQLKQAGQTTVFFSTHLLADVEALCDRMGILHQGQMRFVGTPAQCCQQFASDDLEQAYLRCIDAVLTPDTETT